MYRAYDIDVLLVTNNNMHEFFKSITSLNEQSVAGKLHLHLAVSSDVELVKGIIRDAGNRFASVRFYESKDSVVETYNFLYEQSHGDFVTIWHDDIWSNNRSIELALNVLRTNRHVGAAAFKWTNRTRESFHYHYTQVYQGDGPVVVDFGVFRRRAIGYELFDTSTQSYVLDDLTLKVFFNGYDIGLVPNCFVEHPYTLDKPAAGLPALLNKWSDRFPQARYGIVDDIVELGYSKMEQSSIAICGLARNIGFVMPYTIARLERLGEMFGKVSYTLYESDSDDNTLDDLTDWSRRNPNVNIISEKHNFPRRTGFSLERRKEMALYRNTCLSAVKSKYSDFDYLMVYDTDLSGGFSYDGVAHSFSKNDWDMIAANGKKYMNHTCLYYDTWAHRDEGVWGYKDEYVMFTHSKYQFLEPSDPMFRVYSAFNGLGLYPMSATDGCWYDETDCDHVTLHHKMAAKGRNRVYVNPSMITLYNLCDAVSHALKERKWSHPL